MKQWFSKNKPELLIGFGLGAWLSSTISAFFLAPAMRDAMEEKKKELNVEKLPPVETVKTAAPYVLPSVVFGALGTGMVIAGNQIHVERGTAAMAAWCVAESAYRDYRTKVQEMLGEKKEMAIKDEVVKKNMDRNQLKCDTPMIITGNGNYLCFDTLSGRYFKSDIEKLKRAENLLDRRIIDNMFVSLNEMYIEIGLPPVELGDDIGWHIDTGYVGMEFSYGSAEETGEPCLIMCCSNPQPRYV